MHWREQLLGALAKLLWNETISKAAMPLPLPLN